MELINTIRLIEDGLATVVLLSVMYAMLATAMRDERLSTGLVAEAMVLGLTPFLVWKALGFLRRAFIDKVDHPAFYKTLHTSGEIFEAISGVTLAAVFIFILIQHRKLTPSRV